MTRIKEKSLDFVLRHYTPDAFRPTLVFVSPVRRRVSIAAAVAAGVLVVSAAVYTLSNHSTPAPAPVPVATEQPTAPAGQRVERIEFVDAPLSQVVEAIEIAYGVTVTGLDDDASRQITISYEGTADDVVDVINQLEGTHLIVNK